MFGGGARFVNNIPDTEIESQNISSDRGEDFGKPQDRTAWYITIADGGKSSYSLIAKGIISGVQKYEFQPYFKSLRRRLMPSTWCSILVASGKVHCIKVTFDPNNENNSITVNRNTSASSLMESVDASCEIGQIDNSGICQSLKAKLLAILESIEKGKRNSAIGQMTSFLNELKAQRGKHIKEPALSILMEEGETLQKTINEYPEVTPIKLITRKNWWWPF